MDISLIAAEYRLLLISDDIVEISTKLGSNLTAESFWKELFSIGNYNNLCYFAFGLLCLPVSNADAERLFSQVSMLKTNIRN